MAGPRASATAGKATSTTRAIARDGTELLVRHWPASGDAWGRVLLVHGLAEHMGRWAHVAAQLAEAGLDVTGYDQRGFGGSGGRRAWVGRWSELHDDLEDRLAAVRAAGQEPVVLYGHSMGGLIALGYVLDGRPRPDALVLSAPALSSTIPGWKQVLGRLIAAVRPTAELPNGLDPSHLSRDPEVGEAYVRDPLNVHRSTVGFGVRAFDEQRRLASVLDRLDLPTLVIHGGADRIVPTDSSRILASRPTVRRREYSNLRHELHNEPDGRQVVADVVSWLREVLPSS